MDDRRVLNGIPWRFRTEYIPERFVGIRCDSGATEAELSLIGGHGIGSKALDTYVRTGKVAAISAAAKRWPPTPGKTRERETGE